MGVVAGGVVVGAGGAGVEGLAVGGVACAVAASGLKAIALCQLNQRRYLSNGRWRRWGRRRIIMSAADACEKQCRSDCEGKTISLVLERLACRPRRHSR